MRLKDTIISLLVLLLTVVSGQWSTVNAQIKIGGNVYGGGNAGDTGGSTTVTVREGNFTGNVYGGARMANIAGSAFVNIDGENTPSTSYILINNVYGGNDIAGTIGNIRTVSGESAPLPTTLTKVGTTAGQNNIDNTWNAFVRVSSVKSETTGEAPNQTTTTTNHKVYIGNLYGGSNGDYTVKNKTVSESHKWEIWTKDATPVKVYENDDQPQLPELGKTYLEIVGGSIVYVFGGGNNATVTNKTVICTDNPSEVVNHIKVDKTTGTLMADDATGDNVEELLSDDRITEMGFNPYLSYATSASYQMGSVFGGNNKVAMAIRPTWNLIKGKIRNLYSGGNAGNMTHDNGLLLAVTSNDMEIDNVYGGCRKADVNPDNNRITAETIKVDGVDVSFPADYAARVYITGGNINNVYGGNDISGNVYGGNAVGIHSSINQNVYGGGNGSYAYTDNPNLAGTVEWGDYYYEVGTGESSVEKLNDFRPNAESVSIRISGESATKPVVIGGAIYCGGNSATLESGSSNAAAQLKVGSYVYADNVFLGNNGENMVKESILQTYAGNVTVGGTAYDFSQIDLTDATQMETYMDGAAMGIRPQLVFDKNATEDAKPEGERDYTITYKPYSTYFGSLFVGGNVGSLKIPNESDKKLIVDFDDKIVIYNKVVGGCNNAYINSGTYNAAYQGGVLLPADTHGDKLELNFSGLKIQPKRWKIERNTDYTPKLTDGKPTYILDTNNNRQLEWNTVDSRYYDADTKSFKEVDNVAPGVIGGEGVDASENDLYRRLAGGNIYGGCYSSGIVNGNVIININASIVDRDIVFDDVAFDDKTGEEKLYGNTYKITERKTGVILGQQGMDVLGRALNVFGGGKGVETEIWGSTTINLNSGYVFQIFGGSEEGAIGKRKTTTTNNVTTDDKDTYGRYVYEYNGDYSTYVNLAGASNKPGVPKSADPKNSDGTPKVDEALAECEFIYGGGFEGPIAGDTHVNLDNGRIFNSFAGSCNADIMGNTETYIGANGFPYVRDYVYGGNDLGGKILGSKDFKSRVRTTANGGYDAIGKVHNTEMLTASAYIEYIKGRAEKIYGGCYGVYDYTSELYDAYFHTKKTGSEGTTAANMGTARTDKGYSKPWMDNAFINFRPSASNSIYTYIGQIYGAGQGYFTEKEENLLQNRSYILIDIPDEMEYYQTTQVFGGGECGGVGMGVDKTIANAAATAHKASAIIDLARGHLNAVYGGSYMEGITRRTVINVPAGSTFHGNKIFGGAYGYIEEVETKDNQNNTVINKVPRIDVACDVYEAIVNFNSDKATIDGAIYGGNNACRRTLYGKVNINAPVKGGTHWTGLVNVYGAGYGENTWSQYTEVNLNNGARVQEVYGGGENGLVINKESVSAWKTSLGQDANGKDKLFTGLESYTDIGFGDNETPAPVSSNRLWEVDNTRPKYYNTNVHINRGATVTRYSYGGGLGHGHLAHSGNVYGTTYIDLLGGIVDFDLYAAGTSGSVKDSLAVGTAENKFVASSTAYIEGGKARNVYGGGWAGSVGHHMGTISDATTNDIPGETHVIIGKTAGTSFLDGIPAIERNAYGGGEGGAVWGTTNITLLNGFIGYRHFDTVPTGNFNTIKVGDDYYQEKIDDETRQDGRLGTLYDSGCIFGGGYIDNSSVDISNVTMYGGHVRNSLFGGGEIAAIGRGVIHEETDANGKAKRTLQGLYKAGSTNVTLFDGHVHRNVFGGGRGYNNLGSGGTLFSDGYVFGKTLVNIHGGIVGTSEGVSEMNVSNGNVFGGGDIGYVYGASEEDGNFYVGIKDGVRYDDNYEGYYYKFKLNAGESYLGESATAVENKGQWVMDGTEYILTEDCKVLVEPRCKVLTAFGEYKVGDYVPISYLNTLGNKNDAAWNNLDKKGIIIYNAVFAGGNTTKGSANEAAFANSTSVFGNATASIHDVYNLDLITLGSGRIGGLYGDGNLTFVDGYRGLNITNYGTDYYTIQQNPQIDIADYRSDKYTDRERAYYQLTYICVQDCEDDEGTAYFAESTDHPKASTLTGDDILTLFKNQPNIVYENGNINAAYWKENGVCTIYAGRPMNTIQRADFCGVFGSRMVMQGAQDRVPEVIDYTKYTINRVREVSLNKKKCRQTDPETTEDYHGNYFGIYSVVNYLGALTSDVDFKTAVRKTDNSDDSYKQTVDDKAYGVATYEDWKKANIGNRKRNNGISHNKVALASGVYLELTTERGTGDELNEKDWGLITGVVELDLINVQTGIGGGFVYAKNEHGVRKATGKTHITLTELNRGAVTSDDFEYKTLTTSEDKKTEWQSSGNFVHGEQTIIDDCYNISGKYKGADAVPAHYWYIQGQVYVYDQHISVYTGVPNAYSETVDIPLTITAASHGTMKLLDVRSNKYAYYSSNGVDRLKDGQKLNINDVTYQLNDSISYWDWYKLSKAEQRLFVDETYVVVDDCWIGEKEYKEGYVLLPTEYDELKSKTVIQKRKNDNGVVEDVEVPFTKMFRSSNNMSHETGYILTYKVNNPTEWNTWYTPKSGDYTSKNQTGGNDYENGPTYRLTSGAGQLLGQRAYKISDVIAQEVYDTYQTVKNNHSSDIPSEGQAIFESAYIVTEQIDISGTTTHLYPGAVLPKTEADKYTGKVKDAYVCGKTIQLSSTEFIYVNSKMTLDEKNNYLNRVNTDITAIAGKVISNMNELTDEEINALTYDQKKELRTLLQTKRDIANQITPAYYCTKAGLYGGDYYVGNKNYRGLIAWSSMSPEDRTKFTFNYDALDLLIDSKYGKRENGTQQPEGVKYQYDSEAANLAGAQDNPAGYSLEQRVDYEATYNGSETATYNGVTLKNGETYRRVEYESLPNEQRHYAPINVTDTENDIYVVKKSVTIDNKLYAVGATIDKTTFDKLSTSDQNDRISTLRFTTAGTYYYCREVYTIGENGAQTPVSSASGVSGGTGGNYAKTEEVPVGVVIDDEIYGNLVNKQVNFTIHGIAPTETSTLYVSRDSDIDDLSKGKVITVIYEYNYEESDESGLHITPVTERHVVNIHITFKSGSPTVPDIDELPVVIPGDMLGLREPDVIPGATEVTGGGWELFESMSDAESHTNGIPYTPNTDPLYWYQDGYRLAYYALSYIGGKTYSNHVQVKVANYHDLKKVIEDKEHHYYVDIPDLERLKRNPKIYINDAANGASQLKSLFDLSVLNNPTLDSKGLISGGTFAGHAPLAEQVKNCDNLDFILRTNINHTVGWTSIANNEGECFEGTLHGDGHYISGLSQSLFNHLCGSVFNLGVTGTFTGAGIAETGSGYVENCWIKSTATADRTSKPVFGTPTGLTTDRPYRIVNCYYQENDDATYKYTNHQSTYGIPTRKAEHGFYNGEVAYDLNGFYLYKRYTDKHQGTSEPYKYYTVNEDNTLSDPKDIKYGDNPNYCYAGYVENRYADGDFRYEAGMIPETKEDRQLVDEDGASHFYPIWPDDYLYFGQMLTYRWNESRPHEDVPSPIVKNSGRLLDNDLNNRVYRAPAYFGNSTMSVVHFNPAANLVAYSKPLNATDTNLKEAYPGMTAIDFAGHTEGHSSDAYKLGLNGTWFYQPLLDDDGLLGISNRDETPNLLAYAPAAYLESGYANSKTYDVLNSYFKEPDYNNYYQDGNYRCVTDATKPSSPDILGMSGVHGHLVQSNMQATTDHLLVDKQDFNAPFGYQFDTMHRMWYQRTPENFVDTSKGWDVVSLPFSAELVTTQQKGEITHFYSESHSEDGTTKVGHEYWLRYYKSGQPEGTVFKGVFNYPDAITNGDAKTVNNTFLWDYFYKAEAGHNQQDKHTDTYQTYYSEPRTLSHYPLLAAGTPYIIGFPGTTYYEFDLSGEWRAQNTYGAAPAKLDKQVITFASATGATIAISDDEQGVTQNDYTFKTNYLNQTLTADYLMNDDGNAFKKVPDGQTGNAIAFRPYFIAGTSSAPSPSRRAVQQIIFDSDESFAFSDPDPSEEEIGEGGLSFFTKLHQIGVKSSLRETADVRIYSTSGNTIAAFTIQPGETIEKYVPIAGVYIINAAHGRYTKKISVK